MENANVIFSYTRAEAIADGVLVDVSELARQAGFSVPVAVTAGVWGRCVAVPEGVSGQDEAGRIWDVLNLLRFAAKAADEKVSRVDFAVHVRNDNTEDTPPLVPLYAVCGPGDNLEPVVTVMLIGED